MSVSPWLLLTTIGKSPSAVVSGVPVMSPFALLRCRPEGSLVAPSTKLLGLPEEWAASGEIEAAWPTSSVTGAG